MPTPKGSRPEYAAMAAKIARLRVAAGYSSQSALARAINVSPQTVQQWEDAKTQPRGTNLRKLASALGVTPGDLVADDADGTGLSGIHRALAPGVQPIEWNRWEDLPEGIFVGVPRITVELSAGNGHLVEREEDGPPLAFRSDWLRRERLSRENLRVVNVAGDSMEPYLFEGDVVLVNLASRSVVDGRVYAMRYGDDVRVKRLFRRVDGGLVVRSDNRDAYPDEQIAASDLEHVEIIGQVVWRGG